mgnify:CR=1 FL=1
MSLTGYGDAQLHLSSDYGDFLRSGANTGLEDEKNLDNVNFNMEIFQAFTKGYLESGKSFLLPIEIENLLMRLPCSIHAVRTLPGRLYQW